MRRQLGVLAGAAAIAILAGAAGVMAQDKEAVVKDRQQTMKGLGAGMASIKAYLDGNADLTKASEGATQLASLAKVLPDKFPAGTGMAEFPGKSGAKPVIWTDWNKFVTAQKGLVAEVDKLVTAVKDGDKSKIAEQFASTGKNGCGNCHGSFREKL